MRRKVHRIALNAAYTLCGKEIAGRLFGSVRLVSCKLCLKEMKARG